MSAYPVILDHVHKVYQDDRIVKEHFEGVKSYMDFLIRQSQMGLLYFGSYGDWLGLEKTPLELVSSFFYIIDLEIMVEMAHLMNDSKTAGIYSEILESSRLLYHYEFWNESITCYGNGSQTSQILPIYLDIMPSAYYRNRAVECLATDLERQ